uniref:Uncharacterized protein n=1 Tax=Manihot esculenta TaxID=3983 RepID=A0A2C9VX47_MANES
MPNILHGKHKSFCRINPMGSNLQNPPADQSLAVSKRIRRASATRCHRSINKPRNILF